MASMPKNPYHARSTSLPSRSHPLTIRFEEHLQKLQAWEASSSSMHFQSTIEMLCNGLGHLGDLYNSVEYMLRLPLTQQALQRNGCEKWVDEMLDGCLIILELCEATKNVYKLTKRNVQELLSTLRRRRGIDTCCQSQIGDDIALKKKMKKEIDKCLKALKRTESKVVVSALSEKDQNLVAIMAVLQDVRLITVSIFESLSSSVSMSRPITKTVGWSSISKWLIGAKQVACEGKIGKMSYIEQFDASLHSLHANKSCKVAQKEQIQNTMKALQGMDQNLQRVEDGIDWLFRRLIKTRVSLLNILNY